MVKPSRVKRVRRLLENLALISLFFDGCIAGLTLLANTNAKNWSFTISLQTINQLVNYGLTLIIIFSIILACIILYLKFTENRKDR